jgi:hypothetical protein
MFGAFRHRHVTFQYKNPVKLMFVYLIDRAEVADAYFILRPVMDVFDNVIITQRDRAQEVQGAATTSL